MLTKVHIDFETVEMMVFLWESIVNKEKVGDFYFTQLAEKPAMQVLYGDDFTQDSVRKVLSGLVNREILNGLTKKESKFWSQNMRITEDLEAMHAILNPIKQLNFDYLKETYAGETPYDTVEVFFIPGHKEAYYIQDNRLYVIFYSIFPDMATGELKVEGEPLKAFIEGKIKEIMGKN